LRIYVLRIAYPRTITNKYGRGGKNR
jgi:hypothetical protein